MSLGFISLGFMSLGFMSRLAFCRSRPYAIRVDVAIGFTSFVLMSFGLTSHSGMCGSGECHSAYCRWC